MESQRSRMFRLSALLGVAALVFAACSSGTESAAPGGESPAAASAPAAGESPSGSAPAGSPAAGGGFQCENIGGNVSVYATWTGAEKDNFDAMMAPWLECSGVTMNYTGQRDLGAALTTAIAGGNLPDVAGLPGPGLMQQWYADGVLQPLDFVDFAAYEADTPPGFAALGKAPDGKLAGIFTKGAVKGLIWYNTGVWQGDPPATWEDLKTAAASQATGDTKTWCIGLESGGDSGWPGTDWIEDFVLRQSGTEVYDSWVAGTTPWTDPAIKSAWEEFGTAVENAFGGPAYVNGTAFGKSVVPLFSDPPGCLLHHQASFITTFFESEAAAKPDQYDFFPFPAIDPANTGVEGGGDLFGMFNDTPQAESMIQYLLTPEAQQIWVEKGGFISANKNVPLEAYPDEASRKSAEILANADPVRFDAGDLMPAALSAAFFDAVVEYVDNPGNLDAILSHLEEVSVDARSGG